MIAASMNPRQIVFQMTAAIHDPLSGPEMSNSETCPVPETCTDNEVSSSQEDPLVLRENMSHASNNSQDPGAVLLHADYHSDQLSTNENFKKFDDNVPEDSDDFELNGVYPHYLVSLTGFSVQYVLNAVKLTVIWVHQDPTLFRGGGWTRKILKSGYQLQIFKKRKVLGYSEKYPNNYPVKSNAILGLGMDIFYWSIFISLVKYCTNVVFYFMVRCGLFDWYINRVCLKYKDSYLRGWDLRSGLNWLG
ncbi:unnamed protein product [Schistosoma curassoni]|uniref:Pecanex-like protein n=1 Tax=Schistosoma curassoni TaxID=6186 RepID=A0A183JXG8_9TREM|nr:unnamed protein product [Schistosoma curassoni]